MKPAEVLNHPAWPCIAGVRLQGGCSIPYSVDCIVLGKREGRFEQDEGINFLRFTKACFAFEKLFGHRAANDYRPQPS